MFDSQHRRLQSRIGDEQPPSRPIQTGRAVGRSVSQHRGEMGEVTAVNQANDVGGEFGRHGVILPPHYYVCLKKPNGRTFPLSLCWRKIPISLIDKFPGANGFRDEGKVNTEGA